MILGDKDHIPREVLMIVIPGKWREGDRKQDGRRVSTRHEKYWNERGRGYGQHGTGRSSAMPTTSIVILVSSLSVSVNVWRRSLKNSSLGKHFHRK